MPAHGGSDGLHGLQLPVDTEIWGWKKALRGTLGSESGSKKLEPASTVNLAPPVSPQGTSGSPAALTDPKPRASATAAGRKGVPVAAAAAATRTVASWSRETEKNLCATARG